LPAELLGRVVAEAGCRAGLQCARVCKAWHALVTSNAEPWRSWLRAEKCLVAHEGAPYAMYCRYGSQDHQSRLLWEAERRAEPTAYLLQGSLGIPQP
jgi:hypothetical protein